jgi:hypothetical protein
MANAKSRQPYWTSSDRAPAATPVCLQSAGLPSLSKELSRKERSAQASALPEVAFLCVSVPIRGYDDPDLRLPSTELACIPNRTVIAGQFSGNMHGTASRA